MKNADRKAALIQELEWARMELDQTVRSVSEDLDVSARFRQSVVHRKTAWLGGAVIAGWVLSKLTRRKKKPAALPSHVSEAPGGSIGSTTGRAGLFLAALHALFTLFKPALTAFASQKLSQLATRNGLGSDRYLR